MRLRPSALWGLTLIAACAGGEEPVVRNEGGEGSAEAGASPVGAPLAERASARVVFLGTSLTAGYGLDDPAGAYPGRVQSLIDSAGMPFTVVNAGVSGDTSAGGLARLDWLLADPVDVLFVELGANDGLRGLSPAALEANLDSIIVRTRRRYPGARVVLAGMEAPPNMGASYVTEFRDVFHHVADRHGVTRVPFLLDGVAGVPELNQPDGIHPTAEGHQRIAEHVWATLQQVLSTPTGEESEP